jgi:CheY-like chemotaxis protein
MNVNSLFKRLMLIDDDLIFLSVNKKLIQQLGMHSEAIMTFNNGPSALEYLMNQRIEIDSQTCIILLDINMPGMNGWAFLEALIESGISGHPNLHIYILSSSIDLRDKDLARNYSFLKGYLVKPIRKDNLMEIIFDNQSS